MYDIAMLIVNEESFFLNIELTDNSALIERKDYLLRNVYMYIYCTCTVNV